MATDKSIDPRFDPVFQRGYAAGEGGPREESTRTARTVDSYRQPVATSVAPAPPQVARDERGPSLSAPPSAVAPMPVSDPTTPQTQYLDGAAVVEGPEVTSTPTSLARNPWIYVLWSVGGVLMASGVGGLWWSFKGLYGRGTIDENSWQLFNLAQTASPLCIIAGAFCVASALLVHCLDWMRRNP
ncbi:hypothetical protein [Salinibacterium sp. NK8237]|uniref:hypothetical protein n=1 Tax=Salinibacterium sp. NK8237 TaxID=2792038 RepID=UPI0018CDDF25|nr:hypothetical protein [Salinibacterium sp. NK8237]MBH0130034.1 hypothetical protein [Salinibacterium sp. NK8237]